MPWTKRTKTQGLEEIHNPRFQFMSFIHIFFLLEMMSNQNHYDGFLPRFLFSTQPEVFVTLSEKLSFQLNDESYLDIQLILQKLYQNSSKYTKN